MPYKHKRDCPVRDKPGLWYMSDHLCQVHHMYGDERKKWLGRARFSISYKHRSGSLPACPTHTVKEMRCVCKKTRSVLKPTKAARKVTACVLTKPCPEFLTFGCGSNTKQKNLFCPANFETQSYHI